jgi:polysaccharide biosynthesis/export protein
VSGRSGKLYGDTNTVKILIALACSLLLLAVSPTTSPQEVIHPGDQLSVQVFGEQPQNLTVLADGSIEYPLIGRVPIGGLTVTAASQVLAARLARYVRHPMVTIIVAQQGQPTVLVLGNVKTPGKYQIRPDGRLTDALAAAGGIGQVNGQLPDARISSDSGDMQDVSLEQLLQKGNLGLDMPMHDGDVVYVPGPVTFEVFVSGAVDHPGDIQVSEGDRLAMAIAKAGNSTNSQADLNHIRIMRTGPDGKEISHEYDLYQALQNNDQTADPVLQKGDIVYVPEAHGQNSRNFVNGAGGSGFFYILERLLIP